MSTPKTQPWSWKRVGYRGTAATVRFYTRKQALRLVFDVLKSVPAAREGFKRSCFGSYLNMNMDGAVSAAAIHTLLGQEVILRDGKEDELWFRVGEENIRFSKTEFALVTGLRFGGTSVDLRIKHDIPADSLFSRLFPHCGDSPSVSALISRFLDPDFRLVSADDQLKVFQIIFVYTFVLGVDVSKKLVDSWVWVLIEDAVMWDTFPWGTLGFQNLLGHIQAVKRGPQSSYHLFGCAIAFLIWAFEAIPRLGTLCAKRLNAPQYQLPRVLRWKFQSSPRVDWTHLFDNLTSCHIVLDLSEDERRSYSDWWPHVSADRFQPIQMRMRKRRANKSRTASESQTEEVVEVEVVGPESRPELHISTKRARTGSEPETKEDVIEVEVLEPEDLGLDVVPESRLELGGLGQEIEHQVRSNHRELGSDILPESRLEPEVRPEPEDLRREMEPLVRSEYEGRREAKDSSEPESRPLSRDDILQLLLEGISGLRRDVPQLVQEAVDRRVSQLESSIAHRIDDLRRDIPGIVEDAVDRRVQKLELGIAHKIDDLRRDVPGIVEDAVDRRVKKLVQEAVDRRVSQLESSIAPRIDNLWRDVPGRVEDAVDQRVQSIDMQIDNTIQGAVREQLCSMLYRTSSSPSMQSPSVPVTNRADQLARPLEPMSIRSSSAPVTTPPATRGLLNQRQYDQQVLRLRLEMLQLQLLIQQDL